MSARRPVQLPLRVDWSLRRPSKAYTQRLEREMLIYKGEVKRLRAKLALLESAVADSKP